MYLPASLRKKPEMICIGRTRISTLKHSIYCADFLLDTQHILSLNSVPKWECRGLFDRGGISGDEHVAAIGGKWSFFLRTWEGGAQVLTGGDSPMQSTFPKDGAVMTGEAAKIAETARIEET